MRVIVPFAPGAATDVVARSLAKRLGEIWNQAVIVETSLEPAANIGADLVSPILAQGAAVGNLTMLAGFDGDITTQVAHGATVEIDPATRTLRLLD